MKDTALILIEHRPAAGHPNAAIQQAVTAWLKKELQKECLRRYS